MDVTTNKSALRIGLGALLTALVCVAGPAHAGQRIRAGCMVVVQRTAVVHETPSARGEELFELGAGEELTVLALSDDRAWAEVLDADGEQGWVRVEHVALRDEESEEQEDEEEGDNDDEDDDGDDADADLSTGVRTAGRSPLRFDVRADVAVLRKAQAYRSPSAGAYDMFNTRPFVVVGAGLTYDTGALRLGADVAAGVTVGGDDVRMVDATSGASAQASGPGVAWSAAEANAHCSAGFLFGGGYVLDARLGYRVSSVTIALSEEIRVPSERLSGSTVGLGFQTPRRGALGVNLGVEVMLGGTLEQTENLGDGDGAAVSALYATAHGRYALSGSLGLHATYQLSLESFDWAAGSQTRRDDVQHVLGAGVVVDF
jgi:hypothetical protein